MSYLFIILPCNRNFCNVHNKPDNGFFSKYGLPCIQVAGMCIFRHFRRKNKRVKARYLNEILEKQICFSLSGFISSLYINLNVDNIYYQISQGNKNSIYENCQNIDSEFYMAFKEKIKTRTDLLKNIKKERVLKRKGCI